MADLLHESYGEGQRWGTPGKRDGRESTGQKEKGRAGLRRALPTGKELAPEPGEGSDRGEAGRSSGWTGPRARCGQQSGAGVDRG